MTPTFRIGRIFGIQIAVNWSLVFVFALIAWTLAGTVLPKSAPGEPAVEYWVAAVVGALLFYVGLLAHEMAHALVARSRGVRVAGITLWLFGGVSQLQGEPDSARSEALITVVGPLTSLAVGGVALGGALLTGGRPLVSTVFGWLALLNGALAVFNMIPAFPLDGGRLLSALLWWRSGSRQRGVHRAALVGRAVAYLMIVGGLIEFFLGSILDGMWIVFMGWFLLSAASAEDSATTARAGLRGVPVSAAMSSPVYTIPDWLTVEQFLTSVAPQRRFSTFPLHDVGGRLSGVIRLGDVVQAGPAAQGRRLRDVAIPIERMPRTTRDEPLDKLLARLGPAMERRVLVFDGEELVGILSPADLTRVISARQG
ncbi:MAG TPA: site-2 protease family protein [Candidatus Dormibacteraeota bacterium]|jgi:Zn-dependent protease|nr:site-2 protease family protein [Candidatus Dormibacteraeota bacterium]